MAKLADELSAEGRTPYVIPGGGSNPIGALGYVTCALELAEQANALGLDIDLLVHATGSTGTQAGLLAGLEGSRARHPGARHRRARAEGSAGGQGVSRSPQRTAEMLGVPGAVTRERVVANCDYVGAGYGLPTTA